MDIINRYKNQEYRDLLETDTADAPGKEPEQAMTRIIQRAGITKNRGQPRNKKRVKMQRASRRRNR